MSAGSFTNKSLGNHMPLPEKRELEDMLFAARDLKFKFLAKEGLANVSLDDKILEFADAIFDSAPFLVVNIPGGHIIGASSLAEKLFGYDPGELLSKPIKCLVPDELVHKHELGFLSYCTNPIPMPVISRTPLTGKRKDGSLFEVKIGLHPTRLLGRDAVIATILPVL